MIFSFFKVHIILGGQPLIKQGCPPPSALRCVHPLTASVVPVASPRTLLRCALRVRCVSAYTFLCIVCVPSSLRPLRSLRLRVVAYSLHCVRYVSASPLTLRLPRLCAVAYSFPCARCVSAYTPQTLIPNSSNCSANHFAIEYLTKYPSSTRSTITC